MEKESGTALSGAGKKGKKLSGFSKVFIAIDFLTAALIIAFFWEFELNWFGPVAGIVWFIWWLLAILGAEFNWKMGGTPHQEPSSSSKPSGWSYNSDMTKDYYGKHGEFDRNDESRRVSEDIQQFHNCHPDAKLTDHHFWDDVLDAETDGYLDD